MGKNKLKKFNDIAQMDCVVECPFAMLSDEGFPMRGKWNETFFKNKGKIVLELGCGKGEYTVGLARRYPECNFIGIDIPHATYLMRLSYEQQSTCCLNFSHRRR